MVTIDWNKRKGHFIPVLGSYTHSYPSGRKRVSSTAGQVKTHKGYDCVIINRDMTDIETQFFFMGFLAKFSFIKIFFMLILSY